MDTLSLDSVPTPEQVRASFVPTWGFEIPWRRETHIEGWINEQGDIVPFENAEADSASVWY